MNSQGQSQNQRKVSPIPGSQLASSVEVVAARLGLGRTTIYDLIKTGTLASIKIGRRRLVPETAIVAFLARLQGVAC